MTAVLISESAVLWKREQKYSLEPTGQNYDLEKLWQNKIHSHIEIIVYNYDNVTLQGKAYDHCTHCPAPNTVPGTKEVFRKYFC